MLQYCGLLHSSRVHPKFVTACLQLCSEDCKLAVPLGFFQGLQTSFSCPSTLLPVVTSFIVFYWFFTIIALKKVTQSQCKHKRDLLARWKQITLSQSTSFQDDWLFDHWRLLVSGYILKNQSSQVRSKRKIVEVILTILNYSVPIC